MNQTSEENKNGMNRRDFLRQAGYSALGGVVAAAIPKSVGAALTPEPFVGKSSSYDQYFWKRVQDAFILDPEKVYMNIGTTGSMPRRVLKNYNRYNELVAMDPWNMGGEWGGFPYLAEILEYIAPQFGAEYEPFDFNDPYPQPVQELVLSRNTTDGMCTIIGGFDFKPGDEILTTHHEHAGGISPMYLARDRYGVTINELEIPVFPTNERQFVNLFKQNITRNTKLVVFSHITYKTGTRLPAKKICKAVKRVAERQGRYIPTLIDGAHAPGMLNLDFHDIGCDFYAGSGHKWQCGPGATGFIYMNKDSQGYLNYPINSSFYPYSGFFPLALQLQYVGNDNYPAKRALRDSCEMWEKIGRDRIEDYVLSLSSHCKQRIKETFGDDDDMLIYSPDIPELSSGITSFNPFEYKTDLVKLNDFRDRLREEYDFIIRTTDFKIEGVETHALRISTHLFHNHRQVDDLVDAMYDLYVKMR